MGPQVKRASSYLGLGEIPNFHCCIPRLTLSLGILYVINVLVPTHKLCVEILESVRILTSSHVFSKP